MPLATRELELVIIARDRTSAVLARVGGALSILGGITARVGARGIKEFVEMTQEAIEFRRQVAYAFTQAEIKGATFDDVLNMIRNTARNTSVPLEELEQLAFDIFSTVTLDNMSQARMLMDSISKSAVAGQAPVRDIGRATFAWLNALNIPVNAENVNRILDIQFELVRKGAGTYEEFASVMGRSIPAFVNADQSIEHFAATMAFLTRNGLSAANATASAGRAVELLFSPKAIKAFRSMGIRVTDADGSFRDMEEIIRELVKRFGQMDAASKKLALKDLFGQGTIQARRFFDIVLSEGNFEEFLFLLNEMQTSTGAVTEAFDIMAAEPAVQLEFLRNRFQILRQEIGDAFIPILTERLLPALDRILDIWEGLTDAQKKSFAQWTAWGTVFTTVGGALTSIVGTMILLAGLLKAFTGSALIAAGLAGGFGLAIAVAAALITSAILGTGGISEAWEEFKSIWEERPDTPEFRKFFPEEDYEQLSGPWENFVNYIQTKFPRVWDIVERVLGFIQERWPGLWETIRTVGANIKSWFDRVWPQIWSGVQTVVDNIVSWWENDVWPFLRILSYKLAPIWDTIREEWPAAWAEIWEALQVIWDAIGPILSELWEELKALLKDPTFLALLDTLMRAIPRLLADLMTTLSGIVMFISGVLRGDWDDAWNGLKIAVGGADAFIFDTVGTIAETVTSIFSPEDLAGVQATFDAIHDFMTDPFGEASEAISGYLDDVAARMQEFLEEALAWAVSLGPIGDLVELFIRLAQLGKAPPPAPNLPPKQSLVPGTNIPYGFGGAGGSAVQQMVFRTPVSTTIDKSQIVKFETGAFQTVADPLELANDIAWRIRIS